MPVPFVSEQDRRRALREMDSSAPFDAYATPMLQTTLAVVYRALFNRAPRQLPTLRAPVQIDAKRRAAGDRD